MSNAVIEAIKSRRSCRAFKSDAVPKELIEEVIEAGLWAASGMGKQAGAILAVTNPQMREKLRKVNAQIGGWGEDFDPFYGAPVVLIALARKDCMTAVYDGSLVMGNLMLAAHSLGLGSIWIHRAKEEFEMPEFQELLAQLGAEGEYIGIGHCALGYIDKLPEQVAPRKDGRVFWVE
ncbi:MAG: nitroreductase [Coriobacteriales bacterium]|nr:nitroreductase [Coriobacteriales bacterium]